MALKAESLFIQRLAKRLHCAVDLNALAFTNPARLNSSILARGGDIESICKEMIALGDWLKDMSIPDLTSIAAAKAFWERTGIVYSRKMQRLFRGATLRDESLL